MDEEIMTTEWSWYTEEHRLVPTPTCTVDAVFEEGGESFRGVPLGWCNGWIILGMTLEQLEVFYAKTNAMMEGAEHNAVERDGDDLFRAITVDGRTARVPLVPVGYLPTGDPFYSIGSDWALFEVEGCGECPNCERREACARELWESDQH
jgi:hypothetical protein